MHSRPAKFAWLLVFFCAFGAVDAAARAAHGSCRDCASLRILLMQVTSAANARPAHTPAPPVTATKAEPATATAHIDLPWAMRPPAAHSAHMHAVTATAAI